MKQLKRNIFVSMFPALFIALLLTTRVARAASLADGNNSNNVTNRLLTAVAVVSTNDIWAVGYSFSMGFYHALIEHWDGTSWSVVTAPTMRVGNHLQGVAVVSQNNVWAVSYYFNGTVFQTLIEQWNGSSWSVVTSPNVGTNGTNLWGVAAVSQNDIWTVGAYSNSSSVFQTLTEHWNGSSWSIVNSPNVGTNDNLFNGVAVVSTGNVWAVGSYINSTGSGRTLIEHWNGTKWQVVKSPDVGKGSNNLAGVAVVSSNDVWTVGNYLTASPHFRALTEHWNGTKWQVVKSPL